MRLVTLGDLDGLTCAILLHEVEAIEEVLDKNVIYMDVRGMKNLPAGNRFMVYTIYMRGNVSMRVADGLAGKFISIQVGHSIFNRTCKTHVGELMHKHGGGGHKGAGTCQPTMDKAEEAIQDILETLKANG
jgi:oligoribonuclease NrnB/cAMP/cGMP phosphodiesterase (DHH superfamily)